MIDPLLSRVIAVAFALLWLLAAWHKLSASAAFRATIEEYRLLPAALLPLTTWLIPACEALLGLAWLAGYASFAVPVTVALLLAYAAAIAMNLARGRVHIGCGCGFGGASGEDPPLSWWLVLRNLLLAGLALLGGLPATDRALGAYDWLTMVLALAVLVALFAAASQLLRNGSSMATWRRLRD
jgi:hypothetical protein